MKTIKTYDKILQTARHLFVQQGYTATSMRQIAENAEIGKATIYHHFPDKKSIGLALLNNNISRMGEALELVRIEKDPRNRIRVAAIASIDFLFETADIMQIVRREISGGRDQVLKEYRPFYAQYSALLADAIRRGTEQGIFREVDPTDAARVLMIMIQGTFASAYLLNTKVQSPQQAAESLLDVYFNGIDLR